MRIRSAVCALAIFLNTPLFAAYDGLTTDYTQWANENNYRDVAKSLNTACQLNAPTYGGDGPEISRKEKTSFRFVENLLLRSNKRFSGKSCSVVGNPELILNLRYDPAEGDTTYCLKKDNQPLRAFYYNTTGEVLHQIEAFAFQAADKQADICRYFFEGINSIAQGKPVLAHCSSGKDRTGAYVAMLTYAFAQAMNLSATDLQTTKDRIICDYLRSGNLVYGPRRAPSEFPMSFIVNYDNKYGSEFAYLVNECHIDPALITRAAAKFIKKS